MELTIKDKALIRCQLDSNNDNHGCFDCEISKECDWGANYNSLAQDLLIKLDIKWSDKNI